MKQIFKALVLITIAIVAITGLSSCAKDNETSNNYRFEYSDVSFDTSQEYPTDPETRFNVLKSQLETMLKVAPDEAYIISAAGGQITPSNHQGINATISLKKGSVTIKEWKLEAK